MKVFRDPRDDRPGCGSIGLAGILLLAGSTLLVMVLIAEAADARLALACGLAGGFLLTLLLLRGEIRIVP